MSTAQFVHIGDTHLHQSARQEDRLRSLDQIIEAGLALPKLAGWLWPGDIFHARSTTADRNALKERVKRMSAKAPVIGVYGNHDAPGDLDIFQDITQGHQIRFAATPQTYRYENPNWEHDGEHITIFALPFPTEAGLVGQGVAPDRVVQAAREALEAIMIDAGARLKTAMGFGDVAVMIGHINVSGSVSSTGQPSVGQEIELDAALLDHLPNGCYVGLNHIHKAQQVGRARYAGSICRLNWGEIEPKQYAVIEYSTIGFELCMQPVDVAPMYHVEGEFTRNGFSWQVTDGPDGAPLPIPAGGDWADAGMFGGCEVRARMRYKQSEGVVLADAQRDVRALFESMGCSRFEFEPVCVPDRGLRAPEVALARTLPEKLAAWAKVANVVLPETAADKVMALETRDPDTVVAEVAARMRALTETADADGEGAPVQVVRREPGEAAQSAQGLLL